MRHARLLVVAILALSATRLWAQADTPPPSQTQLTVEDVGFDEKGGRFFVSGSAAVADDTVVYANVIFAGVPGQQPVRGPVKEGKFKLEFEPIGERKWVLAGVYRLQAEVRQEDQAPDAQIPAGLVSWKDLQIGAPEKQSEQVAKIKDQLLEFTENCRRLFLDAEGKASYILLGIDRKKKSGKLTDADKAKYLDAWADFAGVERYWLSTYNRVRMGYDDYHNSIYLSYYPNVEQSFRAVLETLEKWFYSYWHDICAALDQPIPQEIQERGQFFDRISVEGSLTTSVNEIYAALQVKSINWHPVSLYDSEDGSIVKNTYTSKTTTFEVARPDDQWDFQILSEDPVLRLKINPHDEIRRARGHAEVEVKDFPDSTGPKDLTDLVEMTAHDRFPSYKKVSGKPISVPDANFPGGSRPGYDLVFQYESNGIKFKARSYELFCGTFKRTYAVVCYGYQDAYAPEFETNFETICKSFKVLKQLLPEDEKK